jgi:hypothetical protein
MRPYCVRASAFGRAEKIRAQRFAPASTVLISG